MEKFIYKLRYELFHARFLLIILMKELDEKMIERIYMIKME